MLFVGYQAAGTRGRLLVDGAKEIKLLGRVYPVAARVERIDSMSAHADASEIMRWLVGFSPPPRMTYLVHGEPVALAALADAHHRRDADGRCTSPHISSASRFRRDVG